MSSTGDRKLPLKATGKCFARNTASSREMLHDRGSVTIQGQFGMVAEHTQLCLKLALWPWADYFISAVLNSLIYKMEE